MLALDGWSPNDKRLVSIQDTLLEPLRVRPEGALKILQFFHETTARPFGRAPLGTLVALRHRVLEMRKLGTLECLVRFLAYVLELPENTPALKTIAWHLYDDQ